MNGISDVRHASYSRMMIDTMKLYTHAIIREGDRLQFFLVINQRKAQHMFFGIHCDEKLSLASCVRNLKNVPRIFR